jgi:SAM-dependent methyltransferase
MNAKRNYFGYLIPTVCELIEHPTAAKLIRIGLYDSLKCVGVKVEDIGLLIQTIINESLKSKDVCEVEHNLAKLCEGKIVPSILRAALDGRAKKIAQQISPYLLGKRILDLGCGDGMVMNFVEGKEYEVKLADVSNYVDHRINYPFTLLRAPKLKDIACVFDTVLLLTVLHHSSDPEDVVEGLSSLKANRIIVIESVLEIPSSSSPLACLLAKHDFEIHLAFAIFADWFYNRVLHEDVLVPYNLGTVADWHKLFHRYGYYPILSENLGIDQPLVPEVHQLLVYERS